MGYSNLFIQHETVDLVLDPNIRNFVLIPILLVVLAKTFLTTYLMEWMKKTPGTQQREKVLHANCLARSAKITGWV